MDLLRVFEKVESTFSTSGPLNEMATKMAVVLPILRELGWDDLSPSEVAPEFSVPPDGFVDFALCDVQKTPPRPLVFIEVKRVGRFAGSTAEHQAAVNQLFGYAANRGVPIVALTDGDSWEFYLSMAAGPPNDRIFYRAELQRSDNLPEYAENFARYIGKQNTVTEAARRFAEQDLDSNTARDRARNSLPQAWQRLIEDEDQVVRDLLAEAVGEESGRSPDLDDVEEFLRSLSIPASPTTQGSDVQRSVPAPPTAPSTSRQRIVGFVLNGNAVSADRGNRTLAEVLKALESRTPGFLQRLDAATRGTRNRLVAQNPGELFADPRFVGLCMDLENGWWVRSNHSNSEIEKHIQRACQLAGVGFGSQLVITYG